jgi:hypothetical protein
MTRVPLRSNIEICFDVWASALARLFRLELFDLARAPLHVLAINKY